jgi:chorismate dehydratase
MKLGYIDYLNCYSLYYHMFEKRRIQDVEILPGYPTDLNRRMAGGDLDMSPISSAAYAGLKPDVVLLPDFCLSSIGYVRSVVLNSTVPIEDLHRERVGLSRASETSVVLLKILLERYYGVKPVYLPVAPKPSLEKEGCRAALIIGNEALIQGNEPVPFTYDLGELWLRKTGFPVVFAVFAVREAVLEQYAAAIEAVMNSFHSSITCLEKGEPALIEKAGRKYPGIQYDIQAYFSLLQYRFSADLKDALAFYLATAAEMGLLDEVGPLKFIDREAFRENSQGDRWTTATI